ncbi:polysaccharide lyase [Pontibacter sp. FD36]|uniref:polysaccharide lyase n=1 Tax=uncultured Pontibacter sp. TaxID=453356 RepID=UPI001E5D0408|nr:polysaccharide lyase [Pontibacter sp. FD36]
MPNFNKILVFCVICLLLLLNVQQYFEKLETSNGVESTSLTTASLVFSQSFEGSNPLSSFYSLELGAPHSLNIVKRPKGNGKAARFELRQSDPDVKGSRRAEVTVVKGNLEREMWYAYEVYFPSDGFVDEKDDECITQWHQSGMGSPSASIRTKNGRLRITVRNEQEEKDKVDLGPIKKNKWISIVVHMVHSYDSDGLTEVWIDGKKLLSRKGGNMYNEGGMPKLKLGIYKSDWAKEKTTTDKRVLYFDNIQVGRAGTKLTDMISS